MVGELNGKMSDSPRCNFDCQRTSGFAAEAMRLLPTLQRNALRKIFDRHDFLPEEVASLGYKRLHQADGIGCKGLATITAWLESYGFELKPPPWPVKPAPVGKRTRLGIERALRLLRMHGYEVIYQPASDASSDDQA